MYLYFIAFNISSCPPFYHEIIQLTKVYIFTVYNIMFDLRVYVDGHIKIIYISITLRIYRSFFNVKTILVICKNMSGQL